MNHNPYSKDTLTIDGTTFTHTVTIKDSTCNVKVVVSEDIAFSIRHGILTTVVGAKNTLPFVPDLSSQFEQGEVIMVISKMLLDKLTAKELEMSLFHQWLFHILGYNQVLIEELSENPRTVPKSFREFILLADKETASKYGCLAMSEMLLASIHILANSEEIRSLYVDMAPEEITEADRELLYRNFLTKSQYRIDALNY